MYDKCEQCKKCGQNTCGNDPDCRCFEPVEGQNRMTTEERKEKIYWHLVGTYNLAPSAKLPYFGKAPCECCKSELAGDRYEFTGTVGKEHTNERVEVVCCVDCYEYLFT